MTTTCTISKEEKVNKKRQRLIGQTLASASTNPKGWIHGGMYAVCKGKVDDT